MCVPAFKGKKAAVLGFPSLYFYLAFISYCCPWKIHVTCNRYVRNVINHSVRTDQIHLACMPGSTCVHLSTFPVKTWHELSLPSPSPQIQDQVPHLCEGNKWVAFAYKVEYVPTKHTTIATADRMEEGRNLLWADLFWAVRLYIDADSIWSIKCSRPRTVALTGSHSEGLSVLVGHQKHMHFVVFIQGLP